MFLVLIGLLCVALWIWALVDIVRSRFREESTKIIWCLLVVFLPFLGTILYLAIGREQKM
ncbi:PLDc_N domain-containing protein [Pseudoflavitalea sp. X16]|uniref:PLDc N-terminal domain-containing protein n=1 Tax=Paraflavitalea devenefica TaxID=2716334 RepID=UPI00141E0E06|nr:PLD nuclease N-terminal domain-containing protein [Paraflavitalea devenefica]NII23460.1 PLDc_N domain-containing protein [Paraflavitalea devenefica]